MARQFAQFCRIISEGDYVLASDGAKVLGVGRVRGSYTFDASEGFPHMRPVEWLDVGEWRLPTTEGLQTTVHECGEHPENLVAIERRLLERPVVAPPPPPPPVPPSGSGGRWRDGGVVGQIQDILERKGQAILYGPPGTGKTYWAEMAARQLAGLSAFGRKFEELTPDEQKSLSGPAPDALVHFCCFHPAYGYEDFIEGYRPVSHGDALHFRLQDGLFKVLCDAAASAPSRNFYLIIDEINRGDIPRIFGELVTLLEKSKRGLHLKLPISGRDFSVPKNLFVIGTMNTADRSIALLDAALRRRFGFIELMPNSIALGDTVVAGIPLGPWLDALNRLVAAHVGRDGRNLQVGHSYFLHEGRPIDELPMLSRVLLEDVFPLLEEYCYDDWEALGHILGERLVDVTGGRFRMDVFQSGRQDALVQALLALAPEVSASAIALKADSAPPDAGDEAEAEGETV
jgi:5-methylcytosine-specific restriction protein B